MRVITIGVVVVALIAIYVAFILPPSEKISGWGVSAPDGRVVRVAPEESDFKIIIRDLAEGKEWSGHWKIQTMPPGKTLQLFARTQKTSVIFDRRIPVGARELKVGFPEGRDIHGSSDGFSYDVLWRKKEANQSLQPTAPSRRG
jgi:hypothetical protein